jgi:predicted nuclease of predicted toxin-antitoxin system
MEFLLDQGLPRSTVQHLQNIGLQAVHVGSLGFATATDQRILAMRRDRGAIVVTLDSDFHALLARSNASPCRRRGRSRTSKPRPAIGGWKTAS